MPGKLIAGHADLETDCGKCHEAFKAERQRILCLDCHDAIAADVEQKVGLHGRSDARRGAECRTCHSDHLGRDADIVGLKQETFDHSDSDFPLEGAHEHAQCNRCHEAAKKFREAPGQCVDCHRSDDAHDGRMGDACADCHVSESWRSARFDHDKTRFRLLGSHAEVTCALCHPAARYQGVPDRCESCHRLDDAHRGRFGPKCESCHESTEWKKSSFDHGRDTRFALVGRHQSAACTTCHTGTLYKEKLSKDCWGCHRGDDEHRGRNGHACDSCHSPTGWKNARFDHTKDTEFPLLGAHERVGCQGCHRGDAFREKLERSCIACHAADDVHRGQQSKDCGRCHDEKAWTADVFFDHDLSKFPLLGLHAGVACEACHLRPTYKDTRSQCYACHRGDDEHKLRLGTACEICHNPNGWDRWRFDHQTQTRFPLHGAHEGLDCHSCHTDPVRSVRSGRNPSCHACHAREDVHFGAYSSDCEKCHSDTSWSEVDLMP